MIYVQIFSLSNLQSFDYTTYGYNGRMTHVPVDNLIEMLSRRCSNLKARMHMTNHFECRVSLPLVRH